VEGPARLGARNVLFPFAVLGTDPQDRTHAGEPTELVIGDDNVFREHVTVHRGTTKDRGLTRIGSGSLFMVGAHVAHDATIGDRVTLANGTLVGGHASIGDQVVTGGGAAIAPFVRIGRFAFVAAGAQVERDVPPFVIAAGDRARVRTLNRVGLERGGVRDPSRLLLARAFRLLFRSDAPRSKSIEICRTELGSDPYVAELLAFLDEMQSAPRSRAGRITSGVR
jgi:UDP-N-acetylglucosamine acyltransferase